jgi:hypothetical protein
MAAVIVPTTAPWHRPAAVGPRTPEPAGARRHLRVLEGGPSAARAHRRASRPPVVDRRPRPVRLLPGTLVAGLATALVVALALVGLVHLVGAGTAASGPVSTAAPSPTVVAAAPVAASTVVVRPGDTLWTIARSLQPEGDVRDLVDRLVTRAGGAQLTPGQRIDVTGL